MTSLLYPEAQRCGWCCEANATTIVYATPTCLECAAGGSKHRVAAWLRNVKNNRREQRA